MTYVLPWWRKAWVWLKHHWAVPLLVVAGILLMIVLTGSRGRDVRPALRLLRSMDTKRKKADEEVRAIQARAEEEIREVERQHDVDVRNFDMTKKVEYEAVRRKGPRAVARYLSDFDRTI